MIHIDNMGMPGTKAMETRYPEIPIESIGPGIFVCANENTNDSARLLIKESLTAIRPAFVNEKGWFQDHVTDDSDEYDKNIDTLHIISRRSSVIDVSDTVTAASVRLTPVTNIDTILSLNMVAGSEAFEVTIDGRKRHMLERLVEEGVLWDVTRLVTNVAAAREGQLERKHLRESVYHILGAGLTATRRRLDDKAKKVVWIFTIDEKMKKFLESSGIPIEVLAEGKVSPDDKYISYIALMRPEGYRLRVIVKHAVMGLANALVARRGDAISEARRETDSHRRGGKLKTRHAMIALVHGSRNGLDFSEPPKQ